ncbi:hypothetical protein MIC97_16620 [Aquamicrobium sp. NLF2-7]|uniref:hypothetical protein n=1 Tax=Aquamicrobium sp. NLF2-7 TaxID=2918753 RepID=UPI001EFBE08B|nr:hypothetical protein [Aquamicrobium sp. NLF2-7]MCG8273124.1 hypothetical protein [Aquamicrobium sp. NLF2-7]
MNYAETCARAVSVEETVSRSPALTAARRAFLDTGKPSLSIRQRIVLPRDDLDARLDAAIAAYLSHSG